MISVGSTLGIASSCPARSAWIMVKSNAFMGPTLIAQNVFADADALQIPLTRENFVPRRELLVEEREKAVVQLKEGRRRRVRFLLAHRRGRCSY